VNHPNTAFYINIGKIEKQIVAVESDLNNDFMPKLCAFRDIVISGQYDHSIKIEIEPSAQWAIIYNGIIAEGFCVGTIALALDELITIFGEWRT
jgi:hypothetical protein